MTRRRLRFGNGLDLELALGDDAPAGAEVLVVPQDVNLIMGEVTVIEETGETPGEAVAAATAASTPRAQGSVVVGPRRPGLPLVFQAVVYDFQRSPPTCEEHVFAALLTALEEARTRGVRCLGVQPVGTAHGGLSAERFLNVLSQVCYSAAELGTSVRRVYVLLASAEELGRYETLLSEAMSERRLAP
ncbi:MAG TPA: hypothetical protein VN375_12270 [Vicinamibacteria bacterium]|nr:hypothetical protein [Vicinamibacteria bacterium]